MNNDLSVLRVLYVEDNPADAELAQRVLARAAPWIELDIATTIAEVKAALQRAELPDVLATDLHLPDGSGIELVSWLRSCGLALPVVVLTGSGDDQSALTALRAGADDYLTKHGDYLQRLPRILREARARKLRRKAFMGASVRVLFVDADEAEIASVRDCLARNTPNIHVDIAHTITEALAFLPADEEPPVDLLLISHALPDGEGLELAHILRVERGIGLPVVLLADQRSEALIVRAAHEGVDDYLVRHDAYLHELPSTLEKVHRQAVIARERVQLRMTTERLERLLATGSTVLYGLRMAGEALVATWVSDNIERLTGYTAAETMTPGWWAANLDPAMRDDVLAHSARLIADGQLSHEYRFRCRDGRMIWVRDELRVVPRRWRWRGRGPTSPPTGARSNCVPRVPPCSTAWSPASRCPPSSRSSPAASRTWCRRCACRSCCSMRAAGGCMSGPRPGCRISTTPRSRAWRSARAAARAAPPRSVAGG